MYIWYGVYSVTRLCTLYVHQQLVHWLVLTNVIFIPQACRHLIEYYIQHMSIYKYQSIPTYTELVTSRSDDQTCVRREQLSAQQSLASPTFVCNKLSLYNHTYVVQGLYCNIKFTHYKIAMNTVSNGAFIIYIAMNILKDSCGWTDTLQSEINSCIIMSRCEHKW